MAGGRRLASYIGLMAVIAAGPASVVGQEAVQKLEQQVGVDSNEAHLYHQLGRLYLDSKRYDEAARAFGTAVTISPQHAESHLGIAYSSLARGEKYWKNRKKKQGEESVRLALDSNFTHLRHAFLINPLAMLEMKDDEVEGAPILIVGNRLLIPWWSEGFRKGANLVLRGKTEEGYAELSKLRDDARFGEQGMHAPNRLLRYHAIAAGRLKRYDDAVRDFAVLTGRSFYEDTVSIEGELTAMPFRTNDYRYAMGTMLLLAGRHSEATAVFRRVLEFDIGMWPAHVQLARLHEAAGRLNDAIVERERAVDAYPEDATLRFELGRALARAGRNDDAIAALAAAQGLNPRDARIPHLQAELLMAAGRDAEARAPLERFIAIAPARLAAEKEQARQELARLTATPQN